MKSSSKSTPTSNWSDYVPSKLKRKTNTRLRPSILNPTFTAKKEYYKRKLQLMNEVAEMEREEFKRKCEREEEEHTKKMYLLQLEIDLKEKQTLI